MKKILLLLVVFLSFSLTNCDRSETSELSNVTAASKLSDSPSLKGGKIKSDYRVVLEKEFGKLYKKLEKKARDKRNASGDIALAAAPPSSDPIPPAEIIGEMDSETQTEFTDAMAPASISLIQNEYSVNCASASNSQIVLAAYLADVIYSATDEGYGIEYTSPGNFALYTPPGVAENDPVGGVIKNCVFEALIGLGCGVLGTATGLAIAEMVSKKAITRLAIKKIIEAIVIDQAFAAGLTGGQSAAIITGAAASAVFFYTLGCVGIHYIWN